MLDHQEQEPKWKAWRNIYEIHQSETISKQEY